MIIIVFKLVISVNTINFSSFAMIEELQRFEDVERKYLNNIKKIDDEIKILHVHIKNLEQ